MRVNMLNFAKFESLFFVIDDFLNVTFDKIFELKFLKQISYWKMENRIFVFFEYKLRLETFVKKL